MVIRVVNESRVVGLVQKVGLTKAKSLREREEGCKHRKDCQQHLQQRRSAVDVDRPFDEKETEKLITA